VLERHTREHGPFVLLSLVLAIAAFAADSVSIPRRRWWSCWCPRSARSPRPEPWTWASLRRGWARPNAWHSMATRLAASARAT